MGGMTADYGQYATRGYGWYGWSYDAYMPPEAMGGMGPPYGMMPPPAMAVWVLMHTEMMPPPAMAGMDADTGNMPPHAMGGMNADHKGNMPPEAMAGMDGPMMHICHQRLWAAWGHSIGNVPTRRYGWYGSNAYGNDAATRNGRHGVAHDGICHLMHGWYEC